MSTAAVTFDPSQSYAPVAAGFDPSASYAPAPEKGFLDKDIPLDSYKDATLSGVQSIGRGVRDAVTGVGHMIAHPIDTAKSIAQIPEQAAQVPAAIQDINASPDPVGTYAKAAQETAGQGAGQALVALGTAGAAKAVGAAANAIPSASRAEAALQDVKASAGSIPIDTSDVGDTALKIYEQSQRGANLPSSVNKLVRRLTAPNSAPMTYEEAKDFQSNISKLSADEQMKLNPNTKRLVGQLNQNLKGSLEDAADTVGKGQKFADAMKEYHHAMQLKGFSEDAINAAWKAALTGAGLYGASKIVGLDKVAGQ
ncbi:MAG TPA: hypothetical protein VN950_22890 [Terriglobales bacterium]|nr:hypothetical protein [Terriglobales bacterium]